MSHLNPFDSENIRFSVVFYCENLDFWRVSRIENPVFVSTFFRKYQICNNFSSENVRFSGFFPAKIWTFVLFKYQFFPLFRERKCEILHRRKMLLFESKSLTIWIFRRSKIWRKSNENVRKNELLLIFSAGENSTFRAVNVKLKVRRNHVLMIILASEL